MMTLSRKVVLAIVADLACGILIFDAVLYADGQPGNSISQSIIYYSHKCLLLPWLVGFIMGFLTSHLFDSYAEPTTKAGEGES